MKIIVLRDVAFRAVGRPTITCWAGPEPQFVPDWVTGTQAYVMNLACGNIRVPGTNVVIPAVSPTESAADLVVVDSPVGVAVEDSPPQPKRRKS